MTEHTLIIGAGIFGLSAALALRARGDAVTLCAAGDIPHPRAASTDISKVVRADYGSDDLYTTLGMEAIAGWHRWNDALGEQVYFETGVSFLRRTPAQPDDFEYESHRLLTAEGRILPPARPMPAWHPDYAHGYINPAGGWARSGRTLELLAERARAEGVTLRENSPAAELVPGGVRLRTGETLRAGRVLVAAGAWTPTLLPELAGFLTPTGHPVFHLTPADPTLFTPPHFMTFTAEIATSGWYGFPFNPFAGVVKVANHGVGQQLDPVHDEPVVTAEDEAALRAFLRGALPALAEAPITYTRRCLYCDTPDGDFLISAVPNREGVFVATGGSGHGFKFGPVLGGLIADVMAGRVHPRFGWRQAAPGNEAARKTQ
jgi:glycine/D-amino acid oxidase-like deaminating enzyme